MINEHILKLSEVKKRKLLKLMKKNNNYTLIVDCKSDSFSFFDKSFITKKFKKQINGIIFNNNAYHEFFRFNYNDEYKNVKFISCSDEVLDDTLTLDYDKIVMPDLHLCYIKDTQIKNLKVNFKNSSFMINIEDNDDIEILTKDKEYIEISLYSNNQIRAYRLYEDGKVETIGNKCFVGLKYLSEDDKLNLSNFKNYRTIEFSPFINNIKELIIPHSILKNTSLVIPDIVIGKLKVVNDDNMRLIPDNNEIVINDAVSILNGSNAITLRMNSNKCKYINLHRNGKVEIIDDEYIRNNFKNIKEYKFICNNYDKYCVIIKHKKENQFTVITGGKTYNINSGFRRYLMLNNNKFNELLINNDWYKLFSERLNNKDFDKLYNKYLKYMDKLKQLKNLGISNKTLYYACAIDFDKNKDLKYFKGIKEMIDCFDGKEEDAKAIEECGKILIKNIK